MANNALKHVGAADAMIARKIKEPHIKRLTLSWLWMARSSLLHRDNLADEARNHKKRMLEEIGAQDYDSNMLESLDESGLVNAEQSKSTVAYF